MDKKEPPQDPIWTILPSYYMYHLTFSGEVDPPQYQEFENDEHDESSRVLSYPSSAVPTSLTSYSQSSEYAPPDSPPDSDSSFIVADENTRSWRETILDNINELRNLSDSDCAQSNAVSISIHFTKDVGQRGVKPEVIDPSLHEYKQDDLLNGYILIKNEGSEPIPFDMFYVIFEGNVTIADKSNVMSKTPKKVKKFLEMFDFVASWNPASIDRLPSDAMCSSMIPHDPIDDSVLFISQEKKLLPNVLYKRFFTFRIPTRLLDSECNDHCLAGHTELPPTLGLSRDERLSWLSKENPVDDLSFVDLSINHSVKARFIGKAHKYGEAGGGRLINARGEEFVILKEKCSYIRVLQESTPLSDIEKDTNNEAARVLFNSFMSQVKDRIEVGNELKKSLDQLGKGLTLDSSFLLRAEDAVRARSSSDEVKARQLYTRCDSTRDIKASYSRPTNYVVSLTITKKQFLGKPKPLGSVMLTTPKIDYLMSYISPKRYRAGIPVDASSWKLDIPIELSYSPSSILNAADFNKPPEITSVYGEMNVFTVKSNNRPIPIELNHDFLFKNGSDGDNEDFHSLVKQPVRDKCGQLYKLIKAIGLDNFPVERGMVEDLSALAKMEEKNLKLVLHHIKWEENKAPSTSKDNSPTWRRKSSETYTKNVTLHVDVTKAQKKGIQGIIPGESYKAYDFFTLVPNFQTCLVSRLYFLDLKINFNTGNVISFKVPVTISKS